MGEIVVVKRGAKCKSDDDINDAVVSCGWQFINSERVQTLAGKSILRINIVCPDGHAENIAWDNFKPTNGVPRKGCGSCERIKVGNRMRTDITKWTAETGIRVVEEYKREDINYHWICAQGHEFEGKFDTIRIRKYGYCYGCIDAAFARDHNVASVDPWIERTMLVKTKWRCCKVGCNYEFDATKDQIRLGKKKCILCK